SLPYASYVLLQFGERAADTRMLIADLVENRRIDCAAPKDIGPMGSPDIRLNIAFTASGLARLGITNDTLATFPVEFVEGLGSEWENEKTPDHRSRMLGDVGDSEPARWRWGGRLPKPPKDAAMPAEDAALRRVDALLLAYARDPVRLESQVEAWI